MDLKKLIKAHNAIRDAVLEWITKPNPPAEKLVWLPRTDGLANKLLHKLDDDLVACKNTLDLVMRYTLAALTLLVAILFFVLFVASLIGAPS